MITNTILETYNLTKSFASKRIIDNLNLKVMRGDVYGFLGRNGQGKTTTIRLITGLIRPDAGEVIIGGHNLKSDFKGAIRQIGAVVESPCFYGYLSGCDNLMLMANIVSGFKKKEAVMEALDIVGLAARAKDKVKTYSLGMKQRLGIANALLGDPKLVILDEPTNGLDPQGMRQIREIITQLASEKNITFLISSHLLHEVEQVCNRVGIIDSGRLLCEAAIDELAQKAQGKSLEDIYFDLTGNGGDLE